MARLPHTLLALVFTLAGSCAFGAVAALFEVADNQVFSWNSEVYRHRASLEVARGCRDWIVKDNLFSHHTGPAVVFDVSTGHLVKDNLAE